MMICERCENNKTRDAMSWEHVETYKKYEIWLLAGKLTVRGSGKYFNDLAEAKAWIDAKINGGRHD